MSRSLLVAGISHSLLDNAVDNDQGDEQDDADRYSYVQNQTYCKTKGRIGERAATNSHDLQLELCWFRLQYSHVIVIQWQSPGCFYL